jgi:hypothetical protein
MTINFPSISKSTLQGVLSFLTTTGLILLAAPTTTGNTMILSPKVVQWITLGLALARGYTGMITKDAETITSADVTKANAASLAKNGGTTK